LNPSFLPYGRHSIDDTDIAAVTAVLRSDWLTTGPMVERFEKGVAELVGATHAVAVNSGTAALHAAMYALDVRAGDEVIVPALTFAASANCVVYQGATPVFADVEPGTLCIDVADAKRKITPRTKAIIAVDYAGQPCDYQGLRELTERQGIALVADACHSLGGTYRGRNVGTLADLSVFSFHPVKPMTTGEGGMIVTENNEYARRMRTFRNHGITTDHRQREKAGSWFYEMVDLGYNYRICDIQCALGLSQLAKLPGWISRRREIARCYDRLLTGQSEIQPLIRRPDVESGWHLYVVRCAENRAAMFARLRTAGIGVNVHYVPVHLHPFYRRRFQTGPRMCLVAEAAYERILSLPIFPGMSEGDVERVVITLAGCGHQAAVA
jgi:perosamine synthetase